MQLHLVPKENDFFYLYTVKRETGGVLFVGCDKIINIALFKQLITIPQFEKDKAYIIDIYTPHRKYYEGMNAVSSFINTFCASTPYFNTIQCLTRTLPVQCVETGVIYDSANEACKALGIHNPRMSNHLNKRPGHKTIKGLSFVYVARVPHR